MTGWSSRCCPGGGRFRTITITDPRLVPTHRQGQVKLSVTIHRQVNLSVTIHRTGKVICNKTQTGKVICNNTQQCCSQNARNKTIVLVLNNSSLKSLPIQDHACQQFLSEIWFFASSTGSQVLLILQRYTNVHLLLNIINPLGK